MPEGLPYVLLCRACRTHMATTKVPMTANPPSTPPTIAPVFGVEVVVLAIGVSMEAVLD